MNTENKENVQQDAEINDENINAAQDNQAEAESQNNAEETEATEAEANAEESAEPTIEEKLAAAEEKIQELKTQMLYKEAEFANYRKRMVQEKAELIKNGGAKVITTIIPIIDDMERALQTMDKAEDVAAVKEGVKLIIDKFMKLLAQEGLKKMEPIGMPFDTDYHEAVAMVPGMPDDQKGKVIDCVQAGYTLNDKVIRYAKVAVAAED